MSILWGGTPREASDEAAPRETVDDRLWKAFEHPLRRHQIRQIAGAMPGGTEGQADRYLDACVKGGSVVVVHGRAGSAAAVYQRADKAGVRTATPAKAKAAPRAEVVEAEPIEADDEADEDDEEPEVEDDALGPLAGDDDQDDGELDEVVPRARLDGLGHVVRNEITLGDELEDDDEPPPAAVEQQTTPEREETASASHNREKTTMAQGIKGATMAALERLSSGTAGEVAAEAGHEVASVATMLGKAFRDGEIDRPSRGVYAWKGAKKAPPKARVAAPTVVSTKVAPPADDLDLDAAIADLVEKKAAFDAARARVVRAAAGAGA